MPPDRPARVYQPAQRPFPAVRPRRGSLAELRAQGVRCQACASLAGRAGRELQRGVCDRRGTRCSASASGSKMHASLRAGPPWGLSARRSCKLAAFVRTKCVSAFVRHATVVRARGENVTYCQLIHTPDLGLTLPAHAGAQQAGKLKLSASANRRAARKAGEIYRDVRASRSRDHVAMRVSPRPRSSDGG